VSSVKERKLVVHVVPASTTSDRYVLSLHRGLIIKGAVMFRCDYCFYDRQQDDLESHWVITTGAKGGGRAIPIIEDKLLSNLKHGELVIEDVMYCLTCADKEPEKLMEDLQWRVQSSE
jgi:hypothetical protein